MRLFRTSFALAGFLLPVACQRGAGSTHDSAQVPAPQAAAPAPADPATITFPPALGVTLAQFTRRPSGLYVRDDAAGKGTTAADGRQVRVRYAGYLSDGTPFDTSHASGAPLAFTLGKGEVVKGWDEGIVGMRAGGKRTLVVPPALGYGVNSPPGIPPNAVLVFRITLVGAG